MSSRRLSLGCSPVLMGIIMLVLVLGAGGFASNQYLRPLPTVPADAQLSAEREVGTPPQLPWPSKGSAAVWTESSGFLGVSGDKAPRPIASTAKIMTALIILENHPLGLGQQGPEVTITQQDVADYQKALLDGQSVVPVRAGDRLTELELLQGLLLASGNNVADILAKWDAGSKEAFVAKMNARAAALGMTNTHYDDACGLSPKTVSTPSDLLIVSARAMTNPVFRQTVATAKAVLPVVGAVNNYNTALGKDGNIGIKTGTTDEAGGCFVSASIQQVDGKSMEIYSAVLGQDQRNDALDATAALSRAAAASFLRAKVLSRDSSSATLSPVWGDSIEVVPSQDVEMLVWPGTKLKTSVQLETVRAPLEAGSKVGTMTLEVGTQKQQVDLVTTEPIVEPSWQWRATRFLRQE